MGDEPIIIPGWEFHSISSDTAFIIALMKTGLAGNTLPITIKVGRGKMTIKMGGMTIEGTNYKMVRAQFDAIVNEFREAQSGRKAGK